MDLYEKVYRALLGLIIAIKEMTEDTYPETPFPQLESQFKFYNGIVWPASKQPMSLSEWLTVCVYGIPFPLAFNAESLAYSIVEALKEQPMELAKVVSRINEARVWCLDEAAKRKREAQELLSQQTKKEDEEV